MADQRYDVVVIGAGPAGLAAARVAAECGARVALVDAQARPGGQVWRHDVHARSPAAARRAIAALDKNVTFLERRQVVDGTRGALLLETADGATSLRFGALVLACGARELLLPFPGWTLPGVTGAGGLQALVKQGWPIAGKRVVVAGTGPLLLASAATLRRHGARLLGIHEQTQTRDLARFAVHLSRWPARAAQALGLSMRLAGVPYRTGSVVRRALGTDRLEAVEIADARGRRQLECDQLAVGYGLVPNTELAQLFGCELRQRPHAAVATDRLQQTSVPGVLAAGEICGIGGLDAARIEGAIAGHVAAGIQPPPALLRERDRARQFGALVARSFVLGSQARHLAGPDTVVCRCEDVSLGALYGFDDERSTRLATRCGMGPCQGRICGAAMEALGFPPRMGCRPPLWPARMATLALATDDFSPSEAIEP